MICDAAFPLKKSPPAAWPFMVYWLKRSLKFWVPEASRMFWPSTRAVEMRVVPARVMTRLPLPSLVSSTARMRARRSMASNTVSPC